MDLQLANYALRYFSHQMNEKERLAGRHFWATAKITHGRSDVPHKKKRAMDAAI